LKIGIGYDSHRFTEGDHITLGGVVIPFHHGILAHSDGDVLLHATCDALLGALALGDIGQHFPDSDPEFENRCSIDFLKNIYDLVKSKGYQLSNVDSVVVCEQPKIAPYLLPMRENIATVCGVSVDCVSVKATTAEGMGAIGRGEGLSAQVIVCLSPLID
jgi:2-C-methyl-D-erythritol 2,4-cyclodiphosphate synthase